MTGINSFFIFYDFHPRISFDIEANILKKKILIIQERAE